MKRQIVKYPSEILTRKAEPVLASDFGSAEFKELIEDLWETMYASGGIGIAAPQIGVLKRVAVLGINSVGVGNLLSTGYGVLINPVITGSFGNHTETVEGCLSMPGVLASVVRPPSVSISYQDLQGEKQGVILGGMAAVCAQHEIDHLNGVMFIDRVPHETREAIVGRYLDLGKKQVA